MKLRRLSLSQLGQGQRRNKWSVVCAVTLVVALGVTGCSSSTSSTPRSAGAADESASPTETAPPAGTASPTETVPPTETVNADRNRAADRDDAAHRNPDPDPARTGGRLLEVVRTESSRLGNG